MPGRNRRVWALLWICALGAWAPTKARANCAEPVPKLIWSYPADGATDVPTNARIFVLPSGPGPLQTPIEVNGVPIATEPGGYGFAASMNPNTDYEVVVRSNGSLGSVTPLRFRFRTGDGPAANEAPAVPVVARVSRASVRTLAPLCQAALQAMDCFDTGQDTHLVFETPVRPVVFFIEPISKSQIPWAMQWPGDCGDPEIFINGRFPGCPGDHRIVAVGPTGESAATTVLCQEASGTADAGAVDDALPPKPPMLVRSQGCGVGGRAPTSRATVAGFVLLALVLKRQSARRRRDGGRGSL